MKKVIAMVAGVMAAMVMAGAAQAGGISVPGFGAGAVGSGPADKEVKASCFVAGGRLSEGESYKHMDDTYVCTVRYEFRAGKAIKSTSGAMIKANAEKGEGDS